MIEELLGRKQSLFADDFNEHIREIKAKAQKSVFLIVGGAGTIGSAVIKQLVELDAKEILVVDLSENNLVSLIRDIRSGKKQIISHIETFAIDCGSIEFEHLFHSIAKIDYILNFAAIKHVRSERNVFTLKRLIDVNVVNSINLAKLAHQKDCKGYFCVSTDKATNPVNMMGASKLLMEKFAFSFADHLKISSARFANVAFSDGSLLFGFNQRISNQQPLAIPTDIKRYFVSSLEAARLCLLSCFMTHSGEILIPKLTKDFRDHSLVEMTNRYLKMKGFLPLAFEKEEEARNAFDASIKSGQWPCFYFRSETTGEKEIEEFYSKDDVVDFERFKDLGVISYRHEGSGLDFQSFERQFASLIKKKKWDKKDFVSLFKEYLPEFQHIETNKNLDQKM